MTLEEMKEVDVRTVDRTTLMQRNHVRIDMDAPRNERMVQYVRQIGNPYCYLDGKTVVKISFAETDRTIEDCLRDYLCGI